jgi:pimeloyl-ACP methyl ester carboxylesterase
VENTFSNQVDHFNLLNTDTYEQRYWSSTEYVNPADSKAPIFVYICGEYRCSVPDTRLYPFMIGAAYGAEFLVVEHRFYGESQPFPDWSVENLGLLNSQQALADLAYFLGTYNPVNPDTGKRRTTFVIGGSYPGAMAAWFQERYPHLSIGAWSSSGVVQPIVDFWRFDEQVYESTVKSGEECPQSIQDTMAWVTELGKKRDAGDTSTVIDQTLDESTQGMRTDDWMFYYADIFLESVQYGHRTELC